MSNINKPNTFSGNTTISSAAVNANFDTIYNDYNGGISATNLATDAVTTAKIADSNVTTAKIADDSVTPAKWTNPYCFKAYNSVATTLTDNTEVKVDFQTEVYDYNNNFASSTYTAPVAGVYSFQARLASSAISTPVSNNLRLKVNGTAKAYGVGTSFTSGYLEEISAEFLLAANDTVEVYYFQNSAGSETSATGEDLTWFAGHLVHAT